MGFKSTFDRMVAAREKQARRYVNVSDVSANGPD